MPSDEKRRDVARALRNNLKYMLRKERWYGKDLEYKECGNTAYRNIAASVEDCGNLIDGNYIHIVETLADLIDRPTCRVVKHETYYGSFGCEEAGELWTLSCGDECINDSDFPPSYCPVCGAVVVEKEETDAQ